MWIIADIDIAAGADDDDDDDDADPPTHTDGVGSGPDLFRQEATAMKSTTLATRRERAQLDTGMHGARSA